LQKMEQMSKTIGDVNCSIYADVVATWNQEFWKEDIRHILYIYVNILYYILLNLRINFSGIKQIAIRVPQLWDNFLPVIFARYFAHNSRIQTRKLG
jgi:hypothetical protein